MAKSLVEKYEQILTQDPASTVFVELAKALIEQGDHQRAISICESGLSHHQKSVVGRVLWGKALINLGRPAEAMEQFDKAIAIDKENPHAYNLIGEVLLHKGLYRSALPLLKKAVALQPNDGRVRQWLEQTQRALAGGPAPILTDMTQIDAPSQETQAGNDPLANVPSSAKPDEHDREKTDIVEAFTPQAAAPQNGQSTGVVQRASGAPPVTLELPAAQTQQKSKLKPGIPVLGEAVTDPGTALSNPRAQVTQRIEPGHAGAKNGANGKAQERPPDEALTQAGQPDPFAQAPKRTRTPAQDGETIRGLTSTFNALEEDGGAAMPQPAPASSRVQLEPLQSEPSVVLSDESMLDSKGGGGLLDDVPPASSENPVPEPAAISQPVQVKSHGPGPSHPAAAAKRGGGLLDDIPDVPEPTSSVDMPKVELSTQATEAIAQEYERELRDKLAKASANKTFLQRNGLKLAVSSVAVVALLVGVAVFLKTRADNQGLDFKDALVLAKRGILQDSPASYKSATEALERATKMNKSSTEAWALKAYAHAILFAEHGEAPEQRTKAQEALAKEGVRTDFPHLALAADYLIASGKEKDAAKDALVKSGSDKAEVNELIGRILLAEGKKEAAVGKLKEALSADPRSVRALVALGAYFREADDYNQALGMYDAARAISKDHPEAIIGTAESRLKLRMDLDVSVAEVRALPTEGLEGELAGRRVLALGKLLAATGKNEEAISTLSEGQKNHRGLIFEFHLALGEAQVAAAQMDAAQKSFEAALKLRPKSEPAKEALGRVLIARDRPREVLQRISADPGERKVNLVRGIAAAQAGEWKLARIELGKTQLNGKLPAEAATWLALADAADGELTRAQEILERALSVAKRNKADVQVALGKVYLQQKVLDKARAQFEAASKDPEDFEGACQLGLLLISLGLPDLAIGPLTQAVSRNPSHGEARHALIRAQLAQGQPEEALKTAELGQLDNPLSPLSNKDHALALYRNGKNKEAEAAVARALKSDPSDFELHRLRAQIEFARGDGKDAFKSLEKANKLNPKDPQTFCEIGLALMRQGQPDYAFAAFDAAKREGPDAPCAVIGPLYARLPAGSKQTLRELETVLKNVTDVYDRSFALATQARVQLALNATTGAKKSAEEAVKLSPYSGIAHHALGMVALKLKDDATAKASLQKAVELEPAWTSFRLALADTLARGSDEDQQKSVSEYETFLRLGGNEADVARVKKNLPLLKKKLQDK